MAYLLGASVFFLLFEWRLYRLSSLSLASYAQWLQFQIYTMLMEPGGKGPEIAHFFDSRVIL
jgi:hypothetical protein